MRNLKSPENFLQGLEQIVKASDVDQFAADVLSRIAPNADGETRFMNSWTLPRIGKLRGIFWITLSWYLPEIIGSTLRLQIYEALQDHNELRFLEILLLSKGNCLVWLIETESLSERDFFGNIMTQEHLEKFQHYFEPKFKSTNLKTVKRTIRHRGYRDKGTYRRLEQHHDFTTVSYSEELQIEEEQMAIRDTIDFLAGWFT